MIRNSPARIIYNRLLGGWYVVTNDRQFPISTRFDTKQEARDWLTARKAARS